MNEGDRYSGRMIPTQWIPFTDDEGEQCLSCGALWEKDTEINRLIHDDKASEVTYLCGGCFKSIMTTDLQ